MAIRTNRNPKAAEEISPILAVAPLSAVELQDRIAERAYEIYLSRNGTPGDDLNNWLLAEREVCAALSSSIADDVVPAISATAKRKRTSITQTAKATTAGSSTRKPKAVGSTRVQKEKQASK
ncbi:MAG: DUF2934 domain-containing protein [Acidobacteriota bacterium]